MAYKAQDFIDAIPGTGGNISQIADRVGCIWHTVRNAIDNHPTVKTAYEAEVHKVADKARSNINNAIAGGDIATSKWYLILKDPEFTPKQHIDQKTEHSGDGTITVRLVKDD